MGQDEPRGGEAGLRSRSIPHLLLQHWPILAVVAAFAGTAFVIPTLSPTAVSDDFLYARSVEILLDDGELRMLPAAAVTGVFQTVWGVLFGAVFGESLGVLRAATVTFALFGGVAMYALCRELGVTRGRSALHLVRFIEGVPEGSNQVGFFRAFPDAGFGGIWELGQRLVVLGAVYTGLFVLPVAIAALWRVPSLLRRFGMWRWITLGVLVVGVTLLAVGDFAPFDARRPWSPQFFRQAGLGPTDLRGGRPEVFDETIRDVILEMGAASAVVLAIVLLRRLKPLRPLPVARGRRHRVVDPPPGATGRPGRAGRDLLHGRQPGLCAGSPAPGPARAGPLHRPGAAGRRPPRRRRCRRARRRPAVSRREGSRLTPARRPPP
jgi:hypothetical protein